jgi:hypothetical protein
MIRKPTRGIGNTCEAHKSLDLHGSRSFGMKDATSRQYPLQKKIIFHHLLAEIKREKIRSQ